MIERILQFFRTKSYKKPEFKFNGIIPGDAPALTTFSEFKTPFFDELALFYSIKEYHQKTVAIGIPEKEKAFKFHFPYDTYLTFSEDIRIKIEKIFKSQKPVIYLLSPRTDVFADFPQHCPGLFSVAHKNFSKYYNLLADIPFEDMKDFSTNFLKTLKIPDKRQHFYKSLNIPQSPRTSNVFVDTLDPTRLKKLRIPEGSYSMVELEGVILIKDKPFSEQLNYLSRSCCLIGEDSLFTGYALHYGLPVFNDLCDEFYKNSNCHKLKEYKP